MKKIRVWGIKDLLSLSLSLLLAIILAMGSLQLQAEAATATEQNRANDSFQLGRPLVREMEVIITVSNDGNVTARGIQAEVPLLTVPDSPYQKLLAEHFDPKPQHIITDPSGSRRAIFYLGSLPRGEKLNIVINYLLLVYPIEYSLGKSSAAGSGYPGEALVYLEPSTKIESSNKAIAALADKLAAGADNLTVAYRFYSYVLDHITYNSFSRYRNQGALAALKYGEGVCEDMSALFVALCRARGIPARIVYGYADPGRTGERFNLTARERLPLRGLRHAWAEFYLEDYGWIPVDPSFDKVVGGEKYFGSIPEASHILQNYADHPVKIKYRSGNGLSAYWGESLISPPQHFQAK